VAALEKQPLRVGLSSCCDERRRQWRLDENKIRIRMNEATGEIKDVNVDAKAELAPRKKLER
jgi:hypothetical protein